MKKPKTVHLRKNPRALMSTPVWVYSAAKPLEPIEGLLVDLSQSGARICTIPHECPAELVIEWTPVPGLDSIKLSAHRMWAQKEYWGVQFKALSSKQDFLLKALVRFSR